MLSLKTINDQQVLEINLNGVVLTPEDLTTLEIPEGIDTHAGIIISGRAPIWLYVHIVYELQPTVWVACHDPRLGAVVVASYSHQVKVGQVIPF